MTQDFTAITDEAILAELGERVRKERINRNITQSRLAAHAGIGRTVVQQLELGRGCTLRNFVRILRSLGRLDHLNGLLPDQGFSPLQLARLAGRERQRASGRRARRTGRGA
jgi:DNA-binding XRE family transcriptional regulator